MALWGLLDNEASKPKYLNTADKAECYGADTAEVGANAGVNSEGWVLRKVNNGEVMLMIGTDYTDEFYPHTVFGTYT